jgi:hypothetical protein
MFAGGFCSKNKADKIERKHTIMKTINSGIIGAFALLLISSNSSLAVVGQALEVQGTNLVLSWPSQGYEQYLIQYRQTLQPTDSWSTVTNDYPANSTNRSTFIIYGVIPPPETNSDGGDGGGTNPPPPSPDEMNGTMSGSATTTTTEPSEPMAMPANGTGDAAPLILYPPGFNLSGFVIFDPATGQWVSGNGYVISPTASTPSGGLQPMDDPSDDPPSAGFYRVFHIPNWLADVTNYVFDGPTFIPVDFADYMDRVDNLTVLIDGQPTDDSVFTSYVNGGVTNWGVGIYFDLMANGVHTIQLLSTLRISDTLSDNTVFLVLSNAPESIVVSNLVTFTNWTDLIWNNTNYTFQAQSSIPDVNWEIDIYDVNGDFVNSQTGYSADGNISWTWNLTDSSGNPRSNPESDPFFYPYITITQNSDAPQGGPQPQGIGSPSSMPPVAAAFPAKGGWLVAYMDKFYDDGTTNYPGADYYYTNGVNDIVGGAAEWSLPAEEFPIKYGRSYSQADRNNSWAVLADWLYDPDYRDFYYFGHGTAYSIEGDMNAVDASNNITGTIPLPESQAKLTSEYVHNSIIFSKYGGARPYRFVFLDACNTANGNWPWAFGIANQFETLGYYESSANVEHTRPSAFVGWNVELGGNKSWGTIDKFWAYREDWMSEWAGGIYKPESLSESLTDGNTDSGWVSSGQLTAHIIEYGYTDMGFLDYDSAGQWP